MNTLSPSAKNANHVSTTAFSTIDSQLSKNRCGRPPREAQDEERADRDDEGQEQLRQRDTTKSAMQRNTTLPIEQTTAANTRSSRVMPASFSRSSTSWLALSLNASSSA